MSGRYDVTLWWRLTAVVPAAFIAIAESVVTILTLGYVSPNWQLDFLFTRTRNEVRRRHAKAEDKP